MASPAALPTTPQAQEFFEKHIRPLLADNCFSCHGPTKQRAGLRLDSRAAVLKGSDLGPVVTPGDPKKSSLLTAVRHTGDIKMPPKGKLSDEAVADLAAWVEMGLPWPDARKADTVVLPPSSSVAEARRKHWSFQPVKNPPLPAVRNGAWPKTAIDHFVLARLEAKGMVPAPTADKRTLIRRVTFDLTGLPPTPEEVDAFLADDSPEAFARVVDRLLASPAYGERWGRHWLDVARYADTKGYVFQEERRYPYSYTYRDYVIRAFNEDKPYDRFLLEQLAADQLSPNDNQSLAAMGFLTLGRRFLNNVHDIIDDRIDVVSRGLLGLSVGCARCHDHKFDPIPTRDYYALYGVFASSTEPKDLPELDAPEDSAASAAFLEQLRPLEKEVKDFEEANKKELAARNRAVRNKLRELQRRVDRLKVTHPGSPPRAMVLADLPQPVQPVVFLRGNSNNHGPAVPRQFLEVLAGPERKPFAKGSGRLELDRKSLDIQVN